MKFSHISPCCLQQFFSPKMLLYHFPNLKYTIKYPNTLLDRLLSHLLETDWKFMRALLFYFDRVPVDQLLIPERKTKLCLNDVFAHIRATESCLVRAISQLAFLQFNVPPFPCSALFR